MPRPTTPPYTLGAVSIRTAAGKPDWVQARGYFRDATGRRVEATAVGTSAAKARRALQAKVVTARTEHRGGDQLLSHQTKLREAGLVWLDAKARERLRASTMRDYRGYVERSIREGSVAELTLAQVNDVVRIEAWLTEIADSRGETAAKQSRKVLSGILALAERRGAIATSVMHRVKTPRAKPGSVGDRKCRDPDCDYDCGKRHLDTTRAFTAAEAAAVQARADEAEADVGDLAAFLFGTGVRISEALHHTSWSDVDLTARVVRVRGTKTAQADRVLRMSKSLTKRLKRRARRHGRTGLVFGVTYFATKMGEPRDRSNVLRVLRKVFAAAGVPWAGSHTFRRTVASWMDEAGAALAEIANQLGHADINVTATYLGRKTAPSRAADIMRLP